MTMNTWLPDSLRTAWSVVFALILLAHIWHAAAIPGRQRVWHASHILMAAGMIVMFAPIDETVISAQVGMTVFAVAFAVLAVGLLTARVRGAHIGPLWLLSVVDLGAMVYMFSMMNTRLAWLSVLAVLWFVAQTVGWAGGWLGGVLTRSGLGRPRATSSTETVAAPAGPGAAAHTGASEDGNAHPRATGHRNEHPGTRHLLSIRITLAAMAAGMGYMFLAMQFGMTMMMHMHGM